MYSMCCFGDRFINARRRILQPMLDASNPGEAKAKKNKPNSQQRPVQRFWPESIANLQQRSEEGSDDGAEKMVRVQSVGIQ